MLGSGKKNIGYFISHWKCVYTAVSDFLWGQSTSSNWGSSSGSNWGT
jgi:hypothetical protein